MLPDPAQELERYICERKHSNVHLDMFKHVEAVLSELRDRLMIDTWVSCLLSFFFKGSDYFLRKKKLNHIIIYGSAVNNIYMVIDIIISEYQFDQQW